MIRHRPPLLFTDGWPSAALAALALVGCVVLTACGEEVLGGAEPSQTVTLGGGQRFTITPGTIPSHRDDTVQARASVPLAEFALRAGSDTARTAAVALTNVPRSATVAVREVRFLDEAAAFGCPADPPPLLDCATATDPACQPPVATALDADAPALGVELSTPACTETVWGLELVEPDRPIRLAVVGRTSGFTQLRQIGRAAADAGADVLVLLGDNTAGGGGDRFVDLARTLEATGLPAVVVPGEGELVDDSLDRFAAVFGPARLNFRLGNTSLLTFPSPTGRLAEDAVDRLASMLRARRPSAATVAFTHTPPVDPTGPRDRGFDNELQAARILSVLTDAGVDALITGHVNDAADQRINGMAYHTTSAADAGQWLLVEIGDGLSIRSQSFD